MRARIIIVAATGLMSGGVALWLMPPGPAGQRNPSERGVISQAEPAPVPRPPDERVAGLSKLPPEPPSLRTLEDHLEAERTKLTAERAEAFLSDNHRSAASLVAASRVFGNKAYLREAMEKFPNDPRVAFDAYFLNGPYDNTKPASAERRQWLDAMKQADPNNALPHYLAAADDFKAGNTQGALQELQASANKPFDSYMLQSLQSTEEAYRAAGYSEADAKTAASSELLLPHLAENKKLAQSIAELAGQYQQAGDTASAQNLVQAGLNLGQQVGAPSEFPLINTLVGIAIQKIALGSMDPGSPYLDTGTTVQEQLDALNQYRDSLKGLAPQEEAILPRLTDADRANFYDRLRTLGYPATVRWAVEKYGGN